jgi:peptide/nickel transport system substrate-binding protein
MLNTHRRAVLRGAGTSILSLAMPSIGRATGERKSLRIAVQDVPPQLDPLLLEYNSGQRVMFNVYDTLLGMDYLKNFTLAPSLAVEWKRVDDLTLDVVLRKDVRFQDGSTLTAEDVAFTFGPERMTDPKSKGYAPSRAYFGTVSSVDALDDHRVRIRTAQPDPVLEQRFAGWTSQIVSKRAFLRAGDWNAWARNPCATGPYRLTEFKIDERIVLEAFDDYWGGRPPYASISFIVVPEVASRIAGIIAGDFDIITELPTDQFASIRKQDALEVVGGSIANPRVLKFDKRHPVVANVDIRRALTLAIDREAIVDALWAGQVAIPNGPQFPYYGDLYISDYPAPAYDPDKAKRLLAGAGYNREPVPYRTLPGYYAAELQTAQVLKSMWEAVGFNIDLQVRENWGQIFGEKPSFGVRNGTDPILFPDPISSLWKAYGPGSRLGGSPAFWQNDRFDELGGVLATTLDKQKRRAAFKEMLDIYSWGDPPGTVLHTLGMFYAKRKDVAWTPYPAAYMDFRAANATHA